MKISLITVLAFYFITMLSLAQKEVAFQTSGSNDILGTSQKFKSDFFDALSNKSISSHGKAIKNLENCLNEKDDMPVLYYELAQNQMALKQYEQALLSLQKANKLMPNQEIILKSLAQVYAYQQNFEKRVEILNELVGLKAKYGFDLAQAYFFDKQYAAALQALDIYHSKYSYDYRISQLRSQLFTELINQQVLEESLQKQLQWNHQNETIYWQLYSLYQHKGDTENASKIATLFRANVPNAATLAYVDFQQSIASNDKETTSNLYQKIQQNPDIPPYLKSQAKKELKTQNESSQNMDVNKNVERVTTGSSNPNFVSILTLKSVVIPENVTLQVLKNHENKLVANTNNYNLIKETIVLQLYLSKFEEAEMLTISSMEKFPTQPFLHLVQGSLLANKKKYKSAIASFQEGLDYLVENPELEQAFYRKIANSYEQLGEVAKATQFKTKAAQINVPVE